MPLADTMAQISGTKRKRNVTLRTRATMPLDERPRKSTSPVPRPRTPPKVLPSRQMVEQGIWDAFFSNGPPYNLSPRLLKTQNVKTHHRLGVNDFRLKVPNTVLVWGCQQVWEWVNVHLGGDLCSNAFSRWIRSGKQPMHYRPGYERYEQALRADFKRAQGLPGYAMVFRGMPELPRQGVIDESPISATRRLHIASEYTTTNRPGNRTGHQVVALLLPPGTKVLPYGGEDGEYLLPPGKIVPVRGRQRAAITRFETLYANADLQYIDIMLYYAERGELQNYKRKKREIERRRPNHRKFTVLVTPAVFRPDPRWN